MTTSDRTRWFGLAVLSLGVSMIIVDATIVNVALPSIIREFGLDLSDAEWVNSVYSLVFAALLITWWLLAAASGEGCDVEVLYRSVKREVAGVPVIVSEGNEQCRLTSDEGIGVCVDIDDPAAIAGACADLLTAPTAERRALRAHCRTVALGKYTWDHTAVGLVQLYRKLAREGQPSSAGRSIREGAAPREVSA